MSSSHALPLSHSHSPSAMLPSESQANLSLYYIHECTQTLEEFWKKKKEKSLKSGYLDNH